MGKVSDAYGNERVYNLGRQRYNLGTIEYSVNKSGDYDTDFVFKFSPSADDGYLIALHPVPNEENYYYICHNGNDAGNESEWKKVYSEDRRNFVYEDRLDLDNEYLQDYLLKNTEDQYSDNFGYRSGIYEVYLISGLKDAFIFDDNNCVTSAGNNTYNVSEESYSLRLITPNDSGKDFYQGKSVTTKEIIVAPDNNYYYYTGQNLCSTLAGMTFDIDLGDDISGWNYDAIDFDKSYLNVYSYTGQYSKRYTLKKQKMQSITMLEDDYPAGTCRFVLCLYNKGKNNEYDSIETEFDGLVYIDSSTAPQCGGFWY